MSDTLTPQCTALDHVYPRTTLGTSCYCGRRTWGDLPRGFVRITRACACGSSCDACKGTGRVETIARAAEGGVR